MNQLVKEISTSSLSCKEGSLKFTFLHDVLYMQIWGRTKEKLTLYLLAWCYSKQLREKQKRKPNFINRWSHGRTQIKSRMTFQVDGKVWCWLEADQYNAKIPKQSLNPPTTTTPPKKRKRAWVKRLVLRKKSKVWNNPWYWKLLKGWVITKSDKTFKAISPSMKYNMWTSNMINIFWDIIKEIGMEA